MECLTGLDDPEQMSVFSSNARKNLVLGPEQNPLCNAARDGVVSATSHQQNGGLYLHKYCDDTSYYYSPIPQSNFGSSDRASMVGRTSNPPDVCLNVSDTQDNFRQKQQQNQQLEPPQKQLIPTEQDGTSIQPPLDPQKEWPSHQARRHSFGIGQLSREAKGEPVPCPDDRPNRPLTSGHQGEEQDFSTLREGSETGPSKQHPQLPFHHIYNYHHNSDSFSHTGKHISVCITFDM